MKKQIFKIIALLLTIAMLSSCSTQTFIVHGTPGTVISNSNNEDIAVIDKTGQANITLERKPYSHYLLAKSPNSDVKVPFALDYKNHNRNLPNSLICVGAAAISLAIAVTAGQGEPMNIPNLVIGIVGVVGSYMAFIKIMTNSGRENDVYRNYDYLPNQTTNNDLIINNNTKITE
ncbi:MAG: hypothetical protein IJK92_05225 [Bacteroidales bacterium]|nr:hypothetical protein [Bacteroidales bacterium]